MFKNSYIYAGKIKKKLVEFNNKEDSTQLGKIANLTLSVPVSYQQPTSPYLTHTKYDIW